MKGSAIIRKLLYSSWFLAAIPAIVIISFFPPKASKYDVLIEEKGIGLSNTFCSDLDSDGTSELIRWGKGVPLFHIIVMDASQRIYDQVNFKDYMDPDLGTFFTGNFDRDRYSEIYTITYHGDSLFLNINEFFDPEGLKQEHLFISRIGSINGKVTSTMYPAGFFDADGDGYDELYFSISTGFSLEPRRVYYYNLKRGTLKTGQFTGITVQYPDFSDSDGDGKPEIFGFTGASGNYHVPSPFSDWSTWLMVFNENLDFEFPPVEFKGLTNRLHVKAFQDESTRGYLVSHTTGAADTTILEPRLILFSENGKLLKELIYKDIIKDQNDVHVTVSKDGRIFIIGNKIAELDRDLKIMNVTDVPFYTGFMTFIEDIDLDGELEFLIMSIDGRIAVFNSSLELLTLQEIGSDGVYARISHLYIEKKEHKVLFSTPYNSFLISLKKRNHYFLGYLAYPGVYFLCLLFILMVRRITAWQISQKEDLKKRLITLQLQGIKSQLDPHFTFNTLNSVASLIYLQDRETAYDYLNKFTRLLRSMLNDADRVYRRLNEELEFVNTYLELEKLRFGDKFEYSIETGEGVTQREEVPKMVLHTFAENAVKHGIIPRQEGGRLLISIEREKDYLRLIIRDNGIGRSCSAGQSSSTGKGLKLTGEFYEILNQINKRHIRHTITDLYNDAGEPAGTHVEVWVPVN